MREQRTGHGDWECPVIILWLEFGSSMIQGPTQAHALQLLHGPLTEPLRMPSLLEEREQEKDLHCPSSISAGPSCTWQALGGEKGVVMKDLGSWSQCQLLMAVCHVSLQ